MGVPDFLEMICIVCPLMLLIVPLAIWKEPGVEGGGMLGQGVDAADTNAPAIAVLEPKDAESQSIMVVEDKQHNTKKLPRYRDK